MKLDVMSDATVLSMIDNMKRCGLCYEGLKQVWNKANNKHLPYYDQNVEANSLMHEDAIVVYGRSMSEVLRCNSFKGESTRLCFDVSTNNVDNYNGYIVEFEKASFL